MYVSTAQHFFRRALRDLLLHRVRLENFSMNTHISNRTRNVILIQYYSALKNYNSKPIGSIKHYSFYLSREFLHLSAKYQTLNEIFRIKKIEQVLNIVLIETSIKISR